MTQGPYAHQELILPMKEVNPSATFTTVELEIKFAELWELVDGGLLTERPVVHAFTEIGILKNKLAWHDGG